MNLSRISVIAIVGFCLFGLTGAECSRENIERVSSVLAGSSYEPTDADLADISMYLDEHPDVRAKLVGDLREGSAVVSEIIKAESSSIPSSSEPPVSVAYVEVTPPEPVCETTVWRGRYYDCHGAYIGDVE